MKKERRECENERTITHMVRCHPDKSADALAAFSGFHPRAIQHIQDKERPLLDKILKWEKETGQR